MRKTRQTSVFAVVALALWTSVATPQDSSPPDRSVVLEDLVRDLRSDSDYVRRLARAQLAEMAGAEVVTRLTAILRGDEADRLKIEAARVLERMGPGAEAAAPALAHLLDDANEDVREHAVRALVTIRPERPVSPQQLARMIRSDDPHRVRAAVALLERVPEAEPIAAAVALLRMPLGIDPDTAGRVLDALSSLGDRARAAEAAIVELLSEAGVPRDLRARAARTLAALAPTSEQALAALAEYVVARGKNAGLSGSDVEALRPVAEAVTARLIRGGVSASEGWLADLARSATLAPSGPLAELASQGDVAVRIETLRLLAAAGPGAAPVRDVMVAGLDAPSAAVRRAAADALGALGFAGRPAVPALVALLEDEDSRARLWAARALGRVLAPHGDGLKLVPRKVRRSREGLGASARAAIADGLAWLAAHQDADGKWDSDDFMKHDPPEDKCDGSGDQLYDVGVTGLSLLAFLGAGYTDRDAAPENKYAKTVRLGLHYLMQSQAEDGVFGTRATHSFMYNHAIATLAMCEAFWMTGNPRYRRPAQEGLNFMAMARNPRMAWRYEPRRGENDTSVTSWCVLALKSGQLAGLEVDLDAFAGARRWVEKMTDPESGRVGYNYPGGQPARPEGKQDRFPAEKSQSMTAAGVLMRILLGDDPHKTEAIKKGASLCIEFPPMWDGGSIDMYYWRYATLALYQIGGHDWRRWSRRMNRVATRTQHGPAAGSRSGSWPPAGAWGGDGGRVYATSMMLLCLEAPLRFTRVPDTRHDHQDENTKQAVAALEEATKDSDVRLAAAARAALAQIRGT